ncbi:MAG: threonine dehydratase [Chlamydiales bacterium]|jgi:threonine dehydratase
MPGDCRSPNAYNAPMSDIDRPSELEFQSAAANLRGIVCATPLIPLDTQGGKPDILLKLEIHQPVGSFKLRGVFHAVASLSEDQRAHGLSTVSAGNTAKALAWAGRHFGVEARSLMPEDAPRTKVDAVRALGGTPVLVPTADVFRFLREREWEQQPFAFVHPWTDRNVRIGHGSMALEILEQCPQVETVFIPVGGGGLMGGVGTALKLFKPSIRIIAVEPASCPALQASLDAGQPASVECDTICDGVAVPYITDEMYPLLAELTDDLVLVTEADVHAMIKRLAMGNHVIAEGAGALAAAAALQVPAHQRGLSVCLVTGGCIDADKLVKILA